MGFGRKGDLCHEVEVHLTLISWGGDAQHTTESLGLEFREERQEKGKNGRKRKHGKEEKMKRTRDNEKRILGNREGLC